MNTIEKGSIGLVVDSVADLPTELVQTLGNIKIVPFHVYFQKEGQTYDEGVNLSYQDFYQKLAQPELGLPKTQGPSAGEYLAAYQEMLGRYEKIISIHASSKMSVAFNSAQLAREMLPDADITLLDSYTVSMVLGLYALEAARAAKAGASLPKIVAQFEQHKRETVQLFVVSTMKYLRQSGRVNQMQYLLGSALQIKPILQFKDGMGEPAGRELNLERAYVKMGKALVEKFGSRPLLATVVHSQAPDQAQALKERISRQANIQELIVAQIGPTLGAHGGPGMVGMAAFPRDKDEG